MCDWRLSCVRQIVVKRVVSASPCFTRNLFPYHYVLQHIVPSATSSALCLFCDAASLDGFIEQSNRRCYPFQLFTQNTLETLTTYHFSGCYK